ncbi:hypothetical protein JXA59_03195 [Patescibacteria group bacterium]|nr:hypothetical protein [Patescibacteria group bacterium]
MKRARSYRFWEMFPGMTSWLILALPVIFSFVWPAGVAYFIILFDTYWLTKALVMGGHLVAGYIHLKRNTRIDWLERCKKTVDLENWANELTRKYQLAKGFEASRIREELAQVEQMRALPGLQKQWNEVLHVVIYAIYKESYELVSTSLRACADSNYPKDKLVIVLATEERAGESAQVVVRRVAEEYKDVFADVIITVHPDGIAGELKAKGANVYHAGKELQRYVDERELAYDNIMVSCFDADTLPSRQYFANVTYEYILNPERTFRSYQPIPLFNNNLWDVPMLNRLVALGSSYWQMIESTRPHRLINFSSQAMSLKTLVDIDFWDRAIVSEDSRQFYRAYFRYNGNHRAIPIFSPVSMDAVLGKNVWDTMKAQYVQKRRWAWGIEHLPYLMEKYFSTRGQLTWYQRIIHPFRTFEGHVSWSTSSLLIALGGWMPLLLNPEFRTTVLAFNLPVLARNLLSITWVGVVISVIVAQGLLPPMPKHFPRWKRLEMILQWIFVPISGVIFGSIPALDAETRLMLGKYLGFAITAKERKQEVHGILEDKSALV